MLYIILDEFYPPRCSKDSVAACSTAQRPRFTAWRPATLKKASENIDTCIHEGFYNFSDICVPVDLFTPSLYKFDVTGKDIEDNHIMEHEHKKENYSIYR